MSTNAELEKKSAVRLVFWYPGVFLISAVCLGAAASAGAGKFAPHNLANTVRSMTALSALAMATALCGYVKIRKCL